MNYLINYANKKYRGAQKANTWTAIHIAKFDKVIEYSDQDIEDGFYLKNKRILDQTRGNGLWLWKPYFIYKTLLYIQEDDVLYYCDSGAVFLRNIDPVKQIMRSQDIWMTEISLLEKQFTKMEIIHCFSCESEILDSNQVQAGFLAFRKNEKTIRFVNKWLNACCNEALISSKFDRSIQDPSFIEPREDQSILSVMAKKEKIISFQDPTQYSKLPEIYWYADQRFIQSRSQKKDYKPFIFLHRKAKISFKTVIMGIIFFYMPRKVGLLYLKLRYQL